MMNMWRNELRLFFLCYIVKRTMWSEIFANIVRNSERIWCLMKRTTNSVNPFATPLFCSNCELITVHLVTRKHFFNIILIILKRMLLNGKSWINVPSLLIIKSWSCRSDDFLIFKGLTVLLSLFIKVT